MRYKIIIEYCGANFCGWQKQKTGISVQQVVEESLQKILSETIELTVAGRTDAGVHALSQVAHFDAETHLDTVRMRNAINFYLKSYLVSVLHAEKVSQDFSARLSAVKRNYEYRIVNRIAPLTIEKNLCWQIFQQLDVAKMQQSAKFFVGKHDFNAFRSSKCQAKNAIRTIDSVSIEQNNERIFINISAKSFLHNQVRIIVGTLAEIGKGKVLNVQDILQKAEREYSGPTAPAHGLYLKSVEY